MAESCVPYYCPTAGDTECCSKHSGWDVCCDRPDLHVPLDGEVTPAARLADLLRAVWAGPDGTHLYLSPSCLHGWHEKCRSAASAVGGPKAPGTCEHCGAVCACPVCLHGETEQGESVPNAGE